MRQRLIFDRHTLNTERRRAWPTPRPRPRRRRHPRTTSSPRTQKSILPPPRTQPQPCPRSRTHKITPTPRAPKRRRWRSTIRMHSSKSIPKRRGIAACARQFALVLSRHNRSLALWVRAVLPAEGSFTVGGGGMLKRVGVVRVCM